MSRDENMELLRALAHMPENRHGPAGQLAHEAARAAGVDAHSAGQRMVRLGRDGLVRQLAYDQARGAYRWEATDVGRALAGPCRGEEWVRWGEAGTVLLLSVPGEERTGLEVRTEDAAELARAILRRLEERAGG